MKWVSYVFLVIAAVAASCAERVHTAPWSWLDVAALPERDAERDSAPARHLLHEYAFYGGFEDETWISEQLHRATILNSESGRKHLRIDWNEFSWPRDTLLFFQARIIKANGDIIAFDESHISKERPRFQSYDRVEVGDIFEYTYAFITRDTYQIKRSHELSGDIPIDHLVVDISYDNLAEYRFIPPGGDFTFEQIPLNRSTRTIVRGENIPAWNPDLSHATHWSLNSNNVYWVLRRSDQENNTWATFYKDTIKAHLNTERGPDVVAMPDTKHCGEREVMCRMEAALDTLHTNLKPNHEYTLHLRGPVDLQRVHKLTIAQNEEMALVLLGMLEHMGIQANPAWVASRYTRFFDSRVPYTDAFDSMLLRIPKQDGIEEDIWLDPSCSTCAIGELRDAHVGAKAMEFYRKDKRLYTKIRTVTGQIKPPAHVTREAEILFEGPNMTSSETIHIEHSPLNQERFTELYVSWSPVPKFLHQHMPNAQSIESEDLSCQLRGPCQLKTSYHTPIANAGAHGAVIPLAFLSSPWDSIFYETERHIPIVFKENIIYEERIILTVPHNTAVLSIPEAFEQSNHAASVHFSATLLDSFRVEVIRRLEIRAGLYAPEDYSEIRELFHAYSFLRWHHITAQHMAESVASNGKQP